MITREFNPNIFREVLQAIPVAIVATTTEGLVESWNPAAQRILGWTGEEVSGKPAPIELPTSDGEVEIQRRRKDGTAVDLQVRTIPWRDASGTLRGHLSILSDLTALHASQTRVREHVRFRELLEAAPDAIIEIDRDGRVVLMNRVTEKLFGYQREELLGKPVEVLIPETLRHNHKANRDAYLTHPTTRPMGTGLKLEGQRKDGSRFPVEISLSPVEAGVSAIIRDVTDRRLAEEQLRAVQAAYTEELAAKNRELQARNDEVERANHLKSEFLSGMSHELRTPLHTIIGFTELLEEELEGPLNEKQHRFVRHIHKDSQHLLALINDVLDLSKIESGRLELQREFFALPDALEETVSSLRPRAEQKKINIETAAPAGLEIYADRLRFKQILYNLLSNAVKFTPQAGRVSVGVITTETFIEVTVSDTGIGIAPSEHESVFDKFYQVGHRQAGGQEGTGLGLAITRHLVGEHGGSVQLESEPGKGSRFTFTIPLA
jgi:PAS domain S-box-containing protein